MLDEPLEAATPGGGCCGVAEVNTCCTSCFETENDGLAATTRAATPSAAGTDSLMFAW